MNIDEMRKAVQWGKDKGLLRIASPGHAGVIVKERKPINREFEQCPLCRRIVQVSTLDSRRIFHSHYIDKGGLRCNMSSREVEQKQVIN